MAEFSRRKKKVCAMCAGKEVDLWDELESSGIELSDEPNNHWEFTVLSLNEIIYVRKNGL